MGAGGSFLHSNDDDDILGSDLNGSSHGVVKRIPIEMKPRGKLGLRSVGSVSRKPKGGSLRSALSIDLENPEVERIKKDFEMYRLNKENDIVNMQKKEQKLEQENKRLRAELLVLQKTSTNLRGERDVAIEAEQQALARSATFEHDRDKVQRQFKIFRETKEGEIQNLLRAKRDLESKLSKLSHGYIEDDSDTTSRRSVLLDSLGNNYPGDWWTALESEPSITSVHLPVVRGPEFAHSMMELEGPFTNVNKEDWNSVLHSLSNSLPPTPVQVPNHTLRVYISACPDTQAEINIFFQECIPKLRNLCESEGRGLLPILFQDEIEDIPSQKEENMLDGRKQQIERANIFLAFLGDSTNRYTSTEFRLGYLDRPGLRPTFFCFKDTRNRVIDEQAKGLKASVQATGNPNIYCNYQTAQKGAELAFMELEKILKMELGINAKESMDEDDTMLEADGPGQMCGGSVWDVHGDYDQMESFRLAARSSCELGFERYYERLSFHLSSAGPLPPMLITGSAGSGRSLLLAKWIQLQQERSPSSLVLYHFVGTESAVTADPVVILRRFTAQLMQHVSSPPALTCDPVRLMEEFPLWLEKVSSKSPGGAILVLDSIDRVQQPEVHWKWLLDPLPVDVCVIVSVCEDTCPQAWRSWPTLHVEPLSNKNVKELLRAELATFNASITPEEETKILTHCRTPSTCSPMYVMALVQHIAGCIEHGSHVSKHLEALLPTTDCVLLYSKILEIIRVELEIGATYKGLFKSVLRYLCVSRNGLSEGELRELLPSLSWTFLCLLCKQLFDHLILKHQSGLLMFAHEEAKKAVHEFCFGKDDGKLKLQSRQTLIEYFTQFLSLGRVTCRVADELPWLLRQTGDKDRLKQCILNLCIFQRLYARGRCAELIGYWQYVGADRGTMAQEYFNATKKMEEAVGQYNGLITLATIADIYESLGKFLKDFGLLHQALPALQRALEVRETALDPDHPTVARSLHQLAGLHAQWGKFSTAETLYKQALEIYENALGSNHYCVAKELDALAVVYQKQDRHDLAHPLRKKAMSICKKARTPRVSSGQMHAIDPLKRRALQLEELAVGPDSPDKARTLNELGVLYYLHNNIQTAESFFKRSLEMRESLLGPDHPDLAQSLNNLAALFNDRKEYDKAAPLYEKALHIRSQYWSLDHPSIASIIKHLAMLYKKQSKYDLAEPLHKQAVEIREKTFGFHHPSVATALVNLAVLYSLQNRYSEAEPLYERALKIYEDSLGSHHPRVAETLRNLAVMKYEQRDFETAARLYKRATEIKESETTYTGKVLSRRSSSGDTNSTIKNILQT